MILSIPVIVFVNTGIGTFSKNWADLRSNSKILNSWVLEIERHPELFLLTLSLTDSFSH